MKRFALLVGLAGVLVLPWSLASAGGKPSREPLPNELNSFDFAAGLACSFELAGEPVISKEVVTTYPADANGDVKTEITGRLVARLTNVDTGTSIVRNLSGPVTIVIHPDGSHSDEFRGIGLLSLFPTDVPAGPTTLIVYGRFTGTLSPSGQFTVTSLSGRTEDVCAELS